MKKFEIESLVDEVFAREFERFAEIICNPLYYKNRFLQYGMEHHNSLQCIVRTYLEMLKTASPLTKEKFDTWEINQLLVYLNMYKNTDSLDFVSGQMSELAKSFPGAPYIIREIQERFKGFRSVLAKLREIEVTRETLQFLLSSFDSILEFKKLNKREKSVAGEILQQRLNKSSQKNPVKDLIGYRHVVYAYDNSDDEQILIPFVYELSAIVKTFCQEKGFDIPVSKDYIKNPKDTGYQSLHFTIDIVGALTEVQIRTGAMHENAEHGRANHDAVYKNTAIQNFLGGFMYGISRKMGRISWHKGIGLLERLSLSNFPVCVTPHSEVPPTPAQLQAFPDTAMLQNIVNHSPKFGDVA